MVFIRKQKIKGKYYYSLCQRLKKGYKTLESCGAVKPEIFSPKLIKGFAEVELKKIPDNSIDLIIIDPPYGIGFETNHRKEKSETIGNINLDNEKIFETFPDVVRECFRVLKNNSALYCFSRWDVSDRFMKIISQYFVIKNNLIWVKNNWSMGDLTGAYASQYENIIFAVKGKHILNHGRHPDILKFDKVGGKSLLHSCQKPLKLLNFLIKKSSKLGDTVLDCYAGSGSTILASRNMGRQSIGIELEDKYIKILQDRLK